MKKLGSRIQDLRARPKTQAVETGQYSLPQSNGIVLTLRTALNSSHEPSERTLKRILLLTQESSADTQIIFNTLYCALKNTYTIDGLIVRGERERACNALEILDYCLRRKLDEVIFYGAGYSLDQELLRLKNIPKLPTEDDRKGTLSYDSVV
jgi:hypothetical protein